MEPPFANARTLAGSLAAESAKLEAAIDEQIGKLGALQRRVTPIPRDPALIRMRKTTVLLFWIGFALASLTAFAFGFLAGFH